MANIMSLKEIKNSPSRDGFDLSSKRNFTAKAGELLPVWWTEIVQGDRLDVQVQNFTRTMPVNSAAYARMTEYYDFYFVPYSHLWNRANAVLSQMDYNQMHAIGLNVDASVYNGEMPYFTTDQVITYLQSMRNSDNQFVKLNFFEYDRAELSCKLLEYLGYGDFSGCIADTPTYPLYNLDMNAGPLLAYQKIYADYFRNEQWEKPNPSCFNVDYMSGTSSMDMDIPVFSPTAPFYSGYNMFDLRYSNWNMDLYHGLLPSPQYGETAVVPISSSESTISINNALINAYYDGLNGVSGSGRVKFDSAPVAGQYTNFSEFLTGGNNSFHFISTPEKSTISGSSTANFSGGLSILALRQYEFLQKWKEIAQSGKQNYKDITKRIWNVDVNEHLSDMCRYLGGFSSNIDINEVINTNITANNTAEIAGKGISVNQGSVSFGIAEEPGFLMCIYHVQPMLDYTLGYVSPQVLRVNVEDYANPVFDRVGMQAVSSASVFGGSCYWKDKDYATPAPLGYAPRYIDYKTDIDRSFGGFRKGLSHWVVSYDEQSFINDSLSLGAGWNAGLPAPGQIPSFPTSPDTTYSLTWASFKVNPACLNPIFLPQADSTVDTDVFLVSSMFSIKAVRNFDADGLPY